MPASTKAAAPAITPRERDVLASVWAGLHNAEIATRLKISIKTVQAHRVSLNRRLRVNNTASLLREGLRHRLIDVAT